MTSAADRLDEALDDPQRRSAAIPQLIVRLRAAEDALREIVAIPLHDHGRRWQRIARDALARIDEETP